MLELPFPIKLLVPEDINAYYGPWPDLATAYTNIPLSIRYGGLTFGITTANIVTEYWWNDETLIADGDETAKASGGGGSSLPVAARVYLEPVDTGTDMYATFQLAYDAAVIKQVALGGTNKVAIMVGRCTAAQVGDLTLTTAYNANIIIIGESKNLSVLGNIVATNAAGTAYAVTLNAVECTIGSINTSATGATGSAGGITLTGDFIAGALTSSVTDITNTNVTGTAGAINISSAGGRSTVASITQSTLGGTTGALTITNGYTVTGAISVGANNLSSVALTGITITDSTVNTVNITTISGTLRSTFTNSTFSGVFNLNLRNTAATSSNPPTSGYNVRNCIINAAFTITMYNSSNVTLGFNFLNCDFRALFSVVVDSTAVGDINFIPSFESCSFQQSLTHGFYFNNLSANVRCVSAVVKIKNIVCIPTFRISDNNANVLNGYPNWSINVEDSVLSNSSNIFKFGTILGQNTVNISNSNFHAGTNASGVNDGFNPGQINLNVDNSIFEGEWSMGGDSTQDSNIIINNSKVNLTFASRKANCYINNSIISNLSLYVATSLNLGSMPIYLNNCTSSGGVIYLGNDSATTYSDLYITNCALSLSQVILSYSSAINRVYIDSSTVTIAPEFPIAPISINGRNSTIYVTTYFIFDNLSLTNCEFNCSIDDPSLSTNICTVSYLFNSHVYIGSSIDTVPITFELASIDSTSSLEFSNIQLVTPYIINVSSGNRKNNIKTYSGLFTINQFEDVTVSSDEDLSAYSFVNADTTTNDITLTLPASGNLIQKLPVYEVTVKKTAVANNVFIVPNPFSSDTILDGTVTLTELYDTVTIRWSPSENAFVVASPLGGGGGGGGHVIEDEGTPLPQRADLNFVGAGVSATDVGGKTVVTITGGGSGLNSVNSGTNINVDNTDPANPIVNYSGIVGHTIQNEGSSLTARTLLDFQGTGVNVTDSGSKTIVTIPSGGHTIENEGVPLSQQTVLNFVGTGVTATDSGGKTVVTIPGTPTFTITSVALNGGSVNIDLGGAIEAYYELTITANTIVTFTNHAALPGLSRVNLYIIYSNASTPDFTGVNWGDILTPTWSISGRDRIMIEFIDTAKFGYFINGGF